MLWNWPPMRQTEAEELMRARGDEVEVYQATTNTVFMIYMHTQKPPFNNPDLRRAVNLAIDRQELVTKAMEGAGVPCAVLEPKLVGDFALPLDEINKLPGAQP
jgi:ABC-type transport system substrate-binding protein